MGIYTEAEKSYSDVLYNHIVSNNIFPYNDGVLTEAQAGIGGKGRRVDLITRYKLADSYFAIEVKYFPTNFDNAFKQADKLYNVADCAYVAVPAEYISIANEIIRKNKEFSHIGLIPISRIFQTEIPSVRAERSPNPDQNIKKWLGKHFDNPYYWDKNEFHSKKERTFYRAIWNQIQRFIRTPRAKTAMITLYAFNKMYSYEKFVSSKEIDRLGKQIGVECVGKKYKHVRWSCYDLERIGLAESMTLEQDYFRLKPQFSYHMKDKLEELMRSGSNDVVEREIKKINNEQGKLLTNYVK